MINGISTLLSDLTMRTITTADTVAISNLTNLSNVNGFEVLIGNS